MSDVCIGPGARPRKSAVILAGAAGKGPFAAGALGVVAKHEKQFDIVCVVGTSSGALNAAVFAAGLRVDRAGEAAELLEGLWKDTANALHIATMGMRINIVKRALKKFSVYPEARPVKLRIAITTLDGKEAFVHRRHYTTHEAIRHFQGADFATDQGIDDIARHAIASAAIPFIFAPVRLDGTTYVDGGVVDNAPIAWALRQDEEIEDLLVITSDPRVTARPRHISRFPFSPVLNVVLRERLTRDLFEAYSFNKELKQLEAMGVDMQRVRRELKWRQLRIVEIRPPQETPGSFVTGFFCKSQRVANLDAGTAAATRALEERLQCPSPVQPPAPPPPVSPAVQSQHLRKSSELLLIAPIKQGLVPVPYTVTYAVRLRMLLEGLFSLRQVGVERYAGLWKPVGPLETVTTLHFIQWAILDGGTRLLLAVTFEGPWEAYIRGIVDNAGPFLDSIFCHCEGYSDGADSHATANGYDGFARWVRQHQVQVSFFHSAAPDISANDIAWLRKLNGLRGTPDFAKESAELFVEQPAPPTNPADFAKDTTFLQVLTAFFELSGYFPPPDNVFLERSAAKQLWLLSPGRIPLQGQTGAVQDAWDWYGLRVLPLQPPSPPPKQAIPVAQIQAPGTIQGNILSAYNGMVDGLLVFLQFASAAAGAQFVGTFQPTTEGVVDPLARNIALTFAGFDALGLGDLDDLPEEFREGMEIRAPMLGDVGINHPYFWERPLAKGAPSSERVDLSTIHAVVTFQWGTPTGEALLVLARAAIEGPPGAPTGVRILAEQTLHRNRPGSTFVAPFGFVDGVSQPIPADGRQGGDVALGELLLGYANAKGENPRYANPAVFRNGSFLAMRKIKQDVQGFQDFLEGAARGPGAPVSPVDLAGKIMGRYPNGTPLALGAPRGPINNFDYTQDPVGQGCPLGAHIRRANPREEGTPRIMRRGFSYHERVDYDYEEGIVFMAYCASLGSQYELVQKWVNGGNSTGTYGGQVDPMFAVPGISDSAYFYPDPAAAGGAVQVAMPPRALVNLKWGLYLFAPSTAGLVAIAKLALEALPKKAAAPAAGRCPFSGTAADRKDAATIASGAAALEQVDQIDPASALDLWRAWIEEVDPATQEAAGAVFAALRAKTTGFEPTPYGILLSRQKESLALFADRDYSVREYGKRMTKSFGMLTLGQDPGNGYEESSPAPNEFIAKITRADAYRLALKVGTALLAMAPSVDQPGPAPKSRRIVDLTVWADQAFCEIVEVCFGFPDPAVMRKGGAAQMMGPLPCCPDDFRAVSGYIFEAQPTDAQAQAALARGALIASAGATFTKARRQALAGGVPPPNPLTLIDYLVSTGYMKNDDDATSRAWIGAVNGFTVPTGESFERIIGGWLNEDIFWEIQSAYAALPNKASLDLLDENKGGLLATAVIKAFQMAPVPFALHRRVKASRELTPGVVATPDTAVVVLTTSVGQELFDKQSLDYAALFGGAFDPAKPPGAAVHACPGREMALGVLMGLAAAVFEKANVVWEGLLSVSFDA
jgi:predicted acylesterase/phospholipase RssA/deferrochelatase/peroxidase EfeB